MRETYYVGVYDDTSKSLQFYRFVLRGDSFLSKTKFASGWYPAAAVDALVGEAMDEALKRTAGESDSESAPDCSKSVKYFVAGPEGRRAPECEGDRRLAIVMTGDIKAFTAAIQQLADSEALKARLDAFAKKREKKAEGDNKLLGVVKEAGEKAVRDKLGIP